MKIYNTKEGILIEHQEKYFLHQADWNFFLNDENLIENLNKIVEKGARQTDDRLISNGLLPPIKDQEVWAAGVTYMRSRAARMDEAKDAGGGDFYDRVYNAARPELFFKALAHRVSGHGQKVRIRKDSTWNVPEPELTLMISSFGKIIGYTIGNDMSSRSIEGENPLYLPQAKSYDGSTAVGPGILITKDPFPRESVIRLEIIRSGAEVFAGDVSVSQIKRKFEELVEFLFREMSFPQGCLLMTGTGIVPPNDFTLHSGDEVRITIDHIGTLVNYIE
jgi:2-dehydro-3-deoxy-D-arabinonate dehydratase